MNAWVQHMGRKADPRGKDRPRTIVLSGDVAEIAQDLADKSQLSAVLSQLLRQSYGISDDITRLEQLLKTATDERKELQQKEEELIAAIDDAREALIHRRNHTLPSLYQRQGVVEERLRRLRAQQLRVPPKEATLIQDKIMENNRILDTILKEIEELEE